MKNKITWVQMNKKLATSKTKEGIEKLINEYFYSTSFIVKETAGKYFVESKKGLLQGYLVEFLKGEFIFSEVE
jgi:hypothetical protein